MKKIVLNLSFLLVLAGNVCAQQVLTYNKNAYLSGDHQPFVFTNTNVTVGDSGNNVVWDYSALTRTGNMTSYMFAATGYSKSYLYPQANIVLHEDSNDFYFNVTQAGMDEYGTSNPFNSFIYDSPITKFPFPFNYGSSVSGTYTGRKVNLADSTLYNFTGTYSTVADGYGTLILPGNVRIKDVLRVRFTRKMGNSPTTSVTYRWYGKTAMPVVRYPLLSILTNKTGGVTTINHVAYYSNVSQLYSSNSKIISAIDTAEYNSLDDANYNIKISPNPFIEKAKIEYTLPEDANVNIQVFDNLGRQVDKMVNEKQTKGTYTLTFKGTGQFVYYVRFVVNEKLIRSEKIIQLK